MDLLCGYGSGSEDEAQEDSPRAPAMPLVNAAPAASPKASSGLAARLPAPKAQATSLPADFFDAGVPSASTSRSVVEAAPGPVAKEVDLGPVAGPAKPAPASLRQDAQDLPQPQDAQLWNKVPAPRSAAAKKRVVFRPAIDPALLARSDSEEDDVPARAAKKAKASGSGRGASSILSFLPAPKHEAATGPRAGGSDAFSQAAKAAARSKVERQAAAAAAAAAAGAAEGQGPVAQAALLGNEAFRVKGGGGSSAPAAAAAAAAAGGQGYGASGPTSGYGAAVAYGEAYASASYDYAPSGAAGPSYGYEYGYSDPSTSAAAAAGGAAAGGSSSSGRGMTETDLIEAAIAAETAKAARRGGAAAGVAGLGDVAFKEVKAESLKHVDPAVRDARQGLQQVLGTDYVATLRAQAAPHAGDKTARRKHQIGTLFHNARMNEIKLMEQKAQGMKSKAETAGKYGW